MLFSKSCVYGLRASLYLASYKGDDFVSISKLSDQLEIPFHFLTKILQQLTSVGYLESFKGPKGGVKLASKGKSATLYQIVAAIDGDQLFTQCIFGLPGCGENKPCPLHQEWDIKRTQIKEMLNKTTLTDLAIESKERKFRINPDGMLSWQ